MVPTFTWGLSRSNVAFATLVLLLLLSWGFARPEDEPNQDISFPSDTAARRTQRFSVVSLGGFLFVAAQLVSDVRRHLVVAIKLHRVRRATLRVGAQIGGIAEHLRQRHVAGDDLRVAALLHAAD